MPMSFSRVVERLLPAPDAPLPRPPSTRTRSLLGWFTRRAAGPLAVAGLASVVANTIQAVAPAFLGAALDSGIENGLNARVWTICLSLLGLFVIYAVGDTAQSYFGLCAWMRTTFDVARMAGRQVSITGADLSRQVSTGEVASVVASDAQYVGNFFERLAPMAGAVVSFGVVAVLMVSVSARLGLIVLVGMPLVAWIVTLVIRPLQRRQAVQREAQSEVTTITTDTVAGLRILRGIGGEDVFARRYREASQELRRRGVEVAGTQSVLMSLQVLLPGLFVAVVVWAAARLAITGAISAGDLVTFYGYTAYLSWPLMVFSSSVQDYARAVIGLRRLGRLLDVVPPVTGPARGAVVPGARGLTGVGLSRALPPSPARLLSLVVDHLGQGLRRAGPDDVVRRLPGRPGGRLERARQVPADGVEVLAQGVAHDLARVVVAGVEVGQVQVRQLGADLLGDLLLGVVQEHPQTAHRLRQLASVLGQALRTHDNDRHQDDDEELGT